MTDHEFDAVAGKLVGDRNALLRIGDVVAVFDGDFLAEDAAGGIDVGGRLVDAVLHLRAGGGIGAGDRAADAEFDLPSGRRGSRNRKRKTQREAERGDPRHLGSP